MHRRRLPVGWLIGILVATLPALAHAAPPDPLRLVPEQADLFIKIENPHALLDAVLHLDTVRQLYKLEAYREFLNSTNVRLSEQFLAYLEKKLGVSRLEMLDRLTGGGAVLAVKFGPNPAPALLVVQGTDEALLHKFADAVQELGEAELARQEAKERYVKEQYRDIETLHLGKEFHAAVVGSALLVSNFDKGLHAAIDLHLDGPAKSIQKSAHVAEARQLLPGDPLIWSYLNFDTLHKAPQAKEAFQLPRDNPQVTVLFGGLLDVARRAPFLCSGLYRETDGFRLTVRMPRGRDGMPAELATHLPPAQQPGSRQLLEPKGVLYSTSYYFDIAKFWENRTKLFPEAQVKAFEAFDQKSGIFLAGNRFSQFLAAAGPYHRIVVTHQGTSVYKTAPGQRIPAFALIVEMRDPEKFNKSMEPVLRGLAFLASTQVAVKMVEEKHGEHTIISYRFPEDAPLKNDVNNLRFNFSPCFVRVGNQFVASSTLELGRELIDLLEKQSAESLSQSRPAAAQTQIYASGAVELLGAVEDQLFAQIFLDQAFAPQVAQQQVQAFLDLVRGLGTVRLEADYGERDFHYDIQWRLAR